MEHIPVLRAEVQKYLALRPGDRVFDGTLGLGGHALDIFRSIGKNGILYAFEQDERNLQEAKERLKAYSKQIFYFHDNFRYLKTRITGSFSPQARNECLDAAFFDLGLSSAHVDDPSRGFSFMKDGPLDMRFDQRSKLTAADVVNTYPEQRLTEIFFKYGEEAMARKVAKKICEQRKLKPFTTTKGLADFVETFLPKKGFKHLRHPVTKVFQALRIEVNDELSALEEALQSAMELLKVGGRIVVISYHSLEDRLVKKFFQKLERPEFKSMEKAVYQTYDDPIVERLTKKPVIPTEEEIKNNPRSRSAKLRAYKKLQIYPHF